MSDNHKKHVDAHNDILKGRQFGKSQMVFEQAMEEMRQLFIEEEKSIMTEQDWHKWENISEADVLAYPNARTSYELQQSPLWKALA